MPPKIILWIQNRPKTYETILSENGKQLKSGTNKYIQYFKEVTYIDLCKYQVLTPTLKRFILKSFAHPQKRQTYLAGHFTQTDQSGRKICYRALIDSANNEKEECDVLNKEARLYGCSISKDDQLACSQPSKVNSNKKRLYYSLIITFLIIFFIWILKNLKM